MMKSGRTEGRRSEPRMESDVQLAMHRVSVTFALAALLLMGAGFATYVVTCHNPLVLPGDAAIPLEELLHLERPCFGLALMSVGIVVLGLLPGARVLLSLVLYVQRRAWADVFAAVGVLLVLLLSTQLK